jgi:transposase
VQITEEEYLRHYGTPRHSGRYPWGSGGNVDNTKNEGNPDHTENQRNMTFLDAVAHAKAQGMTEKQIADGFGMSISSLRARKSIEKNARTASNIATAQRLKDKGLSTNAIAKRMNEPESTVRNWLKPGAKDKTDVLTSTANMLRDQVDSKGLIDIGSGVENHIGVSATRLNTAVAILKEEGYVTHNVKITQLGTGHETNMKVLCPPGTTWGEVQKNRGNIQQITEFSDDHGRTFYGLHDPLKLDPKRVGINYKEDGGDQADGVIYIRPGVPDVSLGGSKYAQVRVAVGDGHYLKGMAMYKEDLPDGVDIVFNTNKSNTGNKFDAMKPIETDPDNPFGSYIRRQIIDDPGGPNERVTSAMNIVNEEGKWAEWSRTLSSQMLSKQKPTLAKAQLDMTYERRQKDLDDIMKLTNPTVRKRLLMDFAEGTDSASVHLKAAALPRQGVHVILPVSSIPPGQIYAPNYQNGERVVLVRHPHGGTFEIPELVVNNKHGESRKLLGDSRDAVGIHHSVAQHLSGADFDGDTVLVIPNNQGRVTTSPALEGLKNFDPRAAYPAYEGMKPMRNTQTEMGKISNLITDMSLRGASTEHLARAIRHSMVVIDAEKHNLNYKLSENDNGIKDLQEKYQHQPTGSRGASTLISRANSDIRVPHRQPRAQSRGGPIDKNTGAKVFEETGKVNYRTGKPLLTKTVRLAEAVDANALSSGTRMERLYAEHSNKLKSLANKARLEAIRTPSTKYSPTAKQTYQSEVDSLNAKLALAVRNRPLERQAQILAGAAVKLKRDADPNMDDDTLTKIKYQTLEEMRRRTGAAAKRIDITPSEWDAIQAGAISESKLTDILNNADMDTVRKLAAPKGDVLMSSSMTKRANDMFRLGYTRAEVANQLGVSVSTLDRALSTE